MEDEMTTTNNNNNIDHDGIARSVLEKLEGNFEKDGKSSCRACLRSKALPCSQVVDVLSSADVVFSVALVRTMHQIVLQEYTNFPSKDEANDNEMPKSSLSYMNKIVTGIRFVQLLLRLSEQLKDTNDRSGAQHSTTETMPLPPEEVHKMIASLLEKWTEGVCSFIRQAWKEQQRSDSMQGDDDDPDEEAQDETYNAMTADASLDVDPRPVYCFAFSSLWRLNDYVKTRSEMIVPIWKSLGGMAHVLMELSSQGEEPTNGWTDGVPSSLLLNAIQILCDFLREGKRRVERSVIQYYRNGAAEKSCTISFQSKMLCFIATKLSQLMRAYFVVYLGSSDSIDKSHNSLISECWLTLCGLRGIATTFQLLDTSAKKAVDKAPDDFNSSHLSTSTPLCSIAAIVGKITQRCLNTHNFSSMPSKSAVKSLLEARIHAMSPDGLAAPPSKEEHQFEQIAEAVGKVSLLQSILVASETKKDEDIEVLLQIVEDLLLMSIPQCTAALQVAAKNSHKDSRCMALPPTILLNSLRAMTEILYRCDSLPSFDKSRLHRLLLRWLGSENPQVKDDPQHPVHREMVLLLVQAYVSRRGPDRERYDAIKAFLSLLTKILFDNRTARNLRSSVVALLVRLQVSHIEEIKFLSRRLVEREYSSWLREKTISSTSRKRKRNRAMKKCAPHPTELIMIGEAVRGDGLSDCSTTGWSGLLPQTLCTTFDRLAELPTEPEQILLSATDKHFLVMSFVERILLTRGNTSFEECNKKFQLKVGKDLMTVIVAFLRSITAIKFHVNDEEYTFHKKAILFMAALRLSITVNESLGGINTVNLPVDIISSLMAKIVSTRFYSKQDGPLIDKVRPLLQFDGLMVLKSLAKSIRSDCKDDVLQTVKTGYVRLLSPDDWPYFSFGITSLCTFGTTLDAAHKHILRPCLPDSRLKLFQCRISKKIWKDKILGEVEREGISLALRQTAFLDKLSTPRSKVDTAFFASVASFSILPGSWLLEMATQNGRTAQVLFPPGPNSLDDIKYMLGEISESPPVYSLKRFVISPLGDVKCLMHMMQP
ncbi:hypothetical protein IV203_004441 [Nitzschia inconspicua]|uniref:Uncharacterized protein n=1 Tax=Nitzschia inconspicua TaxID=303405 RepID=A0A9K3L3R7_9STRA|nr:hypothetical protein IV203_004441 [Nitzschia inconspicua]